MTKIEYLLEQYKNVLGWYKQSEDKAKFLVTLNTLVVGVVNGLVFIGAEKIGAARRLYTWSIWSLLALSGITLVGSYLFILRAMWPRHHTIEKSLRPAERTWFFGHLASMTREEHESALADWTEDDSEAALISQSRILSRNVWVKHDAMNWAITLTIASLLLLFALGVTYGITVAGSPLPPAAGGGG